MIKKCVLILILLNLAGCTAGFRTSLKNPELRHGYEKNYSINEQKIAHIGQPILEVKDFYAYFKESYNMRLSLDFELVGTYERRQFSNPIKISGKEGLIYHSSDRVEIDGIEYDVINMTNEASQRKETLAILVDKQGNPNWTYILDDNHDRGMKLVPSSNAPAGVSFVKVNENRLIDKYKYLPCYTNYQLNYGGINNVSLTVTYREFTPDFLARPSFYQTIVYETGAKQIRFQNTVIEVLEATNERIVYKVLSDGLTEKPYQEDEAAYHRCEVFYMNKALIEKKLRK